LKFKKEKNPVCRVCRLGYIGRKMVWVPYLLARPIEQSR